MPEVHLRVRAGDGDPDGALLRDGALPDHGEGARVHAHLCTGPDVLQHLRDRLLRQRL